jgi:hypothetical protein
MNSITWFVLLGFSFAACTLLFSINGTLALVLFVVLLILIVMVHELVDAIKK